MSENSGIGFIGLLAIAFIVLKLCHVITWSWWWILAPLWGGVAGGITIILITLSIPYLAIGLVILLYVLNIAVNAPILLFKRIKKYCKKK